MKKLANIEMSALVLGGWNCRCNRGVFWPVCKLFQSENILNCVDFFSIPYLKTRPLYIHFPITLIWTWWESIMSVLGRSQLSQRPCLCLSCRGISLPLFLVASFPLKPWGIDPALRQSVTLDKLPLRWGCTRGRTRWVDVQRHRERK